MEKELILISHGIMAKGLKESCELIMGPQEHIHYVCLLPEEGPDDFQKKFELEISGLELDNLDVFCDLMGGTPCNVVSRLIMEGKNINVLSGMNLPMVIGWVNSQMIGDSSDYVAVAQQGVVNVKEYLASIRS